MADRIRGITVEIGGDTSGLTKSLKSVNGEIKSTQSQLKDVDKLLKLDPTNVDLLKQKEKLLNDQVAETGKKVEELKKIQQTMDENGIDKNSDQYMALQREIVATEAAYAEAKKAADSYNVKLEQVAAKSKQVADKSAEIAKATRGVTVAIAGLGVGAVKTTADFDSAMSQVAATMGVSVDDITELRDFAKKMGSETAFSASEAADGLNVLAMSGLDAQQQMAVLPSVLNLAAAGGIDMATAASYVVGSIKGFGGEMSDAATYADLMAKGATLAATDVGSLGEALSGVSATASSYGQSADGMTEALLRLADQNVTGSEAITGLNRVMSDLYNPSSQASKQLRKLGVSAYDAQGNARDLNDVVNDINAATENLSDKKKTQVLGNIFSDKGLQTFNKMAASSAESLEKFEDGLENAGGSASNQAATQLDNLNGKLTLLKSALEGAAISIGEKLMPYIEKLISWIQSAVDWFNNLSEGQLKTILIIAGVIAAISPVAGIVSKISKGIGFLSKSVLPKLKTAFAFLKANPFILIITAVITLGALIAKNGDKIRAALKKVDDFLKNIFAKDFTEVFGDNVIGRVLNGFVDLIREKWERFKATFEWVIKFCEDLFSGNWSAVWEDLKSAFIGIWDSIKNKFNTVVTFIQNILSGDFAAAFGENSVIGTALSDFSTFVSDTWDAIAGWFTDAYDTVSTLLSGTFSDLFGEEGTFATAFTGLKDFFSTTWTSISGFFTDAYDTVSALLSGDFSTVFGEGSPIRTAFDGCKIFFSDAWDAITGFFTDAYDSVKALLEGDFCDIFGEGSVIGTALNGYRDFVFNIWEGIKGFFQGAYDTISALLSGDFAGAFGEGSPIRSAFDGMKTFFSDTWESIKGFFSGAYDTISELFETDFTDIFGEGSVIGTALNTLRDLFSNRIELIKGFFQGAYDTVSALLAGDFAGAFGEESPIGLAIEAFKTSVSEKVTAISGFFSTCVSTVKSLFEGDFAAVFGEDSLVTQAVNGFRNIIAGIFGEEGLRADIQSILDWINDTFFVSWETAWIGIKDAVAGVWTGIVNAVKSPINSIIDLINRMIDQVNSFIDKINGIELPFGIASPNIGKLGHISKLARGGVVPMGGAALVGERGPELLTVGNGHATVTPLGGKSGGSTVNVYTQQMTEAQVDYLIARVNRGLMYA